MPEAQWNQYYNNLPGTRTPDSPASYGRDGSYIPSGKEIQSARIDTVRQNAAELNKWQQQNQILSGQNSREGGYGVGGPVNMYGQPIKSFWVNKDSTGMPPAPDVKPLPTYDFKPGSGSSSGVPAGWGKQDTPPMPPMASFEFTTTPQYREQASGWYADKGRPDPYFGTEQYRRPTLPSRPFGGPDATDIRTTDPSGNFNPPVNFGSPISMVTPSESDYAAAEELRQRAIKDASGSLSSNSFFV
jgi:hypothetical protein